MIKKAVSLISAGIDSPVASWMMQKKGLEVIGIHFSNGESDSSNTREKTVEICRLLNVRKLYILNHVLIVQALLAGGCYRRYLCVLCRRMMFRIAERIAEKEGCSCIITGENLGQVASQTLDNMTVAASAVSIPVLRPLVCYDKQQTVDIAEKIGTYSLSVEAHACCNAAPRNPVINSVLFKIEQEEERIDARMIVEKLISEAEVLNL